MKISEILNEMPQLIEYTPAHLEFEKSNRLMFF
jgi:hypothetical protein